MVYAHSSFRFHTLLECYHNNRAVGMRNSHRPSHFLFSWNRRGLCRAIVKHFTKRVLCVPACNTLRCGTPRNGKGWRKQTKRATEVANSSTNCDVFCHFDLSEKKENFFRQFFRIVTFFVILPMNYNVVRW